MEKIHIWLKSDKNIGHFTWRPKLLLLATLNRRKSTLFQWNVIKVLARLSVPLSVRFYVGGFSYTDFREIYEYL